MAVQWPAGYQSVGDDGDLFGAAQTEGSLFRGVAEQRGDATGEIGRLMTLRVQDRTRADTVSGPVSNVFQSLGTSATPITTSQWPITFYPSSAAYTQTFLDSVFVDYSGGVLFSWEGGGEGDLSSRSASEVEKVDSTRVYWSDSEVEVGGNSDNNATVGLAASHFLRMTDPDNGATSEDTVTYTCSGGETTLLVPTNLLAIGHPDYQLVDYSASDAGLLSLITSTNWANSSGTDLGYTVGLDLRQPYLEVHLSSGCTGGDVFRAGLAVS